ncbi:hypothetical protein J9303_01060 [Bacillaceae bacterium Marseille-Q3522]|nr:hypothetical protein [Bacillaceae bacterium Marseille-Q3522]
MKLYELVVFKKRLLGIVEAKIPDWLKAKRLQALIRDMNTTYSITGNEEKFAEEQPQIFGLFQMALNAYLKIRR